VNTVNNNVTNNVVNGVVDNSVKVTLNVWGGESTSHLTIERMREIVETSTERLGGRDAVPEMLVRSVLSGVARAIWLEEPANHVAYLPNVKENRARVRTAHGWEERSSAEVVEAMHEKAKDETSRKQPMETSRDIRLMDPVLKGMGKAAVTRAEMRALLVTMRPKAKARAQAEEAAAAAAVAEAEAAAAPAATEGQEKEPPTVKGD
jgi:hypothetical protein